MRRSPEDGAGGGRTDVHTDGRVYGRTDSPCVLQDFIPFGAAALLPINLNNTLLKQGTGTTDHLLPGLLFHSKILNLSLRKYDSCSFFNRQNLKPSDKMINCNEIMCIFQAC